MAAYNLYAAQFETIRTNLFIRTNIIPPVYTIQFMHAHTIPPIFAWLDLLPRIGNKPWRKTSNIDPFWSYC